MIAIKVILGPFDGVEIIWHWCHWFCAEMHVYLKISNCLINYKDMQASHFNVVAQRSKCEVNTNVLVNVWMPGVHFLNWLVLLNGTSKHIYVSQRGQPRLPTTLFTVDFWMFSVKRLFLFVFSPSDSATLRNAPAACSLVGLCRRGLHVI